MRLNVGAVLSADIAVPEHARELRFYSQVLGTGSNPLWREDLLNNFGTPIIGLGAESPEYEDLPLQWMPHIQVRDVSASVDRALALGGKELMHGKDESGASQWAVLIDPNGAAFGLIPVVSSDANSSVENAPSPDADAGVGRIAWLDLTVPDASATAGFYQAVVTWSAQHVGIEDSNGRYANYNLCGDDGNPAAGVRLARDADGGVPPVWIIYLPVGDLAESLRRVDEGGGEVIKTSQDENGGHASAVIRDPVGAFLGLVAG